MYARVWFGNAEPEKRDEIVQLIRDSVLPAARQQQGYKGYRRCLTPVQARTMSCLSTSESIQSSVSFLGTHLDAYTRTLKTTHLG